MRRPGNLSGDLGWIAQSRKNSRLEGVFGPKSRARFNDEAVKDDLGWQNNCVCGSGKTFYNCHGDNRDRGGRPFNRLDKSTYTSIYDSPDTGTLKSNSKSEYAKLMQEKAERAADERIGKAIVAREGALTVDLEAQKATRDELQKRTEEFNAAQLKFAKEQADLVASQTELSKTQAEVRAAMVAQARAQEALMKKLMIGGGAVVLLVIGAVLLLK